MNYNVVLLKSFRRDLKTIKRRGYDLELLYAVTDALRLSKGMTYKNAVARLPFGGGKSVIIGNAKEIKSKHRV